MIFIILLVFSLLLITITFVKSILSKVIRSLFISYLIYLSILTYLYLPLDKIMEENKKKGDDDE